MYFPREYLDMVLVPLGLLNMLFYHLFLLYKYKSKKHRKNTSMGKENDDKRDWVMKILQLKDDVKEKRDVKNISIDRGLAVIASNTSASMSLATISLTLCSLIGAWMGNSTDFFSREITFGNTSSSIISIKYICLLSSFLFAFSCFIQSARHFVHSNYLLSTPGAAENHVGYAQKAVERGSEFWLLGIRALYFALNFLLWFFGPIPMFVSSMIMVIILYCHDLCDPKKDSMSKSNNQRLGERM